MSSKGGGGLFDVTTPRDLFEKARVEIESFHKDPNDYGLFNLLFTLNHLREWICPGGHSSYKGKPASSLTAEERLHYELYQLPDYRIVQALCNRTKHLSDEQNVGSRTTLAVGCFAGISYAGDSLAHRNYFIDGQDLRVIIGRVYRRYLDYFDALAASGPVA